LTATATDTDIVVRVVAQTAVDHDALRALGYSPRPETTPEAQELIEFAGRLCYASFDRPNPATAANPDYIANIIDHQHLSVLEHATVSMYLAVPRSVLAEITRHRHFSFSVISQRFVDASGLHWHLPPAVAGLPGPQRAEAAGILAETGRHIGEAYQRLVALLGQQGLPRKQVREAARAVLPNMVSSPLVMTGNHRAWREFLLRRHSVHADRSMQVLAAKVLAELRRIAPDLYADIDDRPHD